MKRIWSLMLLMLLLSLALVACTGATAPEAELVCDDPIGCVEIGPDEPILLASALVIAGPNAPLGTDSQRGIEIAIEFRGQVLGHDVALQPEDDGCSAEGGQTAGQKIVSNPQVVAVIATSCSGAAVPMSTIVANAGFLMVSPSNTAPSLTDPDQREAGYFRTAHNDNYQGAGMAQFVYEELGLRRVAAIHDGDPYTEGLARVFSESFEALGGTVVAFEAEAPDATNVEPLLTTVAANEPELIYYPVFIPLGSLITKTARELEGLENTILSAADGIQSPDFFDASGPAAEGMYASGPDLRFSGTFYSEEFVPAYEARYGTGPSAPFHAHAFDATNIILNAVEAVAQVGEDGTLLIGRQALRDAVAATSGHQGITGTITCDANGDCADPKIAVSVGQGGQFVTIWPPLD
jgi:branched-chain amino acid transport system substrate-binding protein